MNNGIVNIHGKQYMTVAKRVELWHEDRKANNGPLSIETEVLIHDPVVVKAVVKWNEKTFTGISSANPAKLIEKENPYEVAETSAVGRALGFAGYGLIESVASADEMVRATNTPTNGLADERVKPGNTIEEPKGCSVHEVLMEKKYSATKKKDYWCHRNEEGLLCFGAGYLPKLSSDTKVSGD